MNSACRYFETPECNINSIGGNEMSNAPGYQMPNSINGNTLIYRFYTKCNFINNFLTNNQYGTLQVIYSLDLKPTVFLHKNYKLLFENVSFLTKNSH